jgi:DNA primase
MTRRYNSAEIGRAARQFDYETFLLNAGVDCYERSEEIVGFCPFCHWKRTSFYVKVGEGVWICHYCDRRGGPVQLIADVLDTGYSEAIERIMEGYSGVWDDTEDDEEEEEEEELAPIIELPDEFRALHGNKSVMAKKYRKYLYGRTVTDEMIRRYNIGYATTGRDAGRVIVPVTYLGDLVTYVARSIRKDATRKVMTPPGNEQGRYLFNLDHIWGAEKVVVTEGVFDAMTLDDKAVATFGKKISAAQINALLHSGAKDVILCWDADADDENRAQYERMLATFNTVKTIDMPEDEDPNSLGRDEMEELLRTAKRPKLSLAVSRDVAVQYEKVAATRL